MQFLKKIAIIGPESTGKSTISAQLATHFHTVYVPEYARSYIDTLSNPYSEQDLLEIAKGQIALEEKLSLEAKNNLLFCDTDLNVIKVWSNHKYGRCHPWIIEQINNRKYDYYFLTDIDLPWQYDPQREHPEPEMRRYFFNIYNHLVLDSNVPFAILSGDESTRLKTAISKVNDILIK